jgi:hypothetical protein
MDAYESKAEGSLVDIERLKDALGILNAKVPMG